MTAVSIVFLLVPFKLLMLLIISNYFFNYSLALIVP